MDEWTKEENRLSQRKKGKIKKSKDAEVNGQGERGERG